MRFLESEFPFREARECLFHIIPVPFEATVSYGGGAAHGPEAILEASQQLEVWTGSSTPGDKGIFTWPAVDCSGSAENTLKRIEDAVLTAIRQGPDTPKKNSVSLRHTMSHAPTLPVVLGGEHTVTLGVLRALQKEYGDFGIIHFDAHADLRHEYGGSIYSHACVMRRAVDDLGLALFQVGVRSLSPGENTYRKEHGIGHLDARDAWMLSQKTPQNIIPASFPEKVFLSFDIDALDASIMPATGTPEPGGLLWWDALNLVENCLAGRYVLGFDVVELAPIQGMHAPNYTAARLVHEVMGMLTGAVAEK